MKTDLSPTRRSRHVLLPLPAVLKRTGLGKTAVYTAMREYDFPRPIRVGARRVAWLEDEVVEWIERRIEERDAMPPPRERAETGATRS